MCILGAENIMDIDKKKRIKTLIFQCNALRNSVERSLQDTATLETGRYASFKTYAKRYNEIAKSVLVELRPDISMSYYDIDKMPEWSDSLWPHQRQIMESILLETDMLLSYLESESDFLEDECDSLENFIRARLRSCIFCMPTKEIEIQNAIETLLIGKGWKKGIDYDRECGRVRFSGKDYVPDFTVKKLQLCIEVKLIREGKKADIIEQVNSDIIGYSKAYKHQMYVIYDLGVIRDEEEFRRDIENTSEEIRVIVITWIPVNPH